MKKSKNVKTGALIKTVLGGAAGGAIVQVVKGTLMKEQNSLYTDLGAIALGAVLPAVVKMDGVAELGAGMIGAGAASAIVSAVPSLAGGFNSALYGAGQAGYRQRMISGRIKKKGGVISTLG